jgi:hypothetical protein
MINSNTFHPSDPNVNSSQILAPWSPQDMLEITLNEPDDFLKVRETLTRIGVASKKEVNTLYQSCHLLHKRGYYFIVHFKEMFMLDGKPSDFSMDDLGRRNTIAQLLSDWGLLHIVKPASITAKSSLKNIKIISHKDKNQWKLIPKYQIGNIKKSK